MLEEQVIHPHQMLSHRSVESANTLIRILSQRVMHLPAIFSKEALILRDVSIYTQLLDPYTMSVLTCHPMFHFGTRWQHLSEEPLTGLRRNNLKSWVLIRGKVMLMTGPGSRLKRLLRIVSNPKPPSKALNRTPSAPVSFDVMRPSRSDPTIVV